MLDTAAALGADLFGAGAGILGGLGHHLDLGLAGLGVEKLDAVLHEGDAVVEQLRAFATEARAGGLVPATIDIDDLLALNLVTPDQFVTAGLAAALLVKPAG